MNWKLFVPLGLCAVGAVGGYMYASHKYGEDIANIKLEAAIIRAEDGRKSYEKLVAAQNALDASRRGAVRLSDELDRVRRAYEDRERDRDGAPASVDRETIARCERLLVEGAELVAEGAELLREGSARHDALVEAVR